MKDHHFCIKVLQKERVYNSQKEQGKPSLRLMNRCNSCNISMYIILIKKKKKIFYIKFSEHVQHYKTF